MSSVPAETNLSSIPVLAIKLSRRVSAFAVVHLGACAALLAHGSTLEWGLVLPIATLRGLVVTIGYHRYFSHRSFKTSRIGQFILAVLCCLNLQNGPLWWAAVHRHHHLHSDDADDYHSPVRNGFWFGHFGWLFCKLDMPTQAKITDLTRYPELVWLERFWLAPPIVVGALVWFFFGWSCLLIDFFFTSFLVLHMTFLVNSLAHLFGSRRFETGDSSRNSFLLAFATLGDGWHNNHHAYPRAAQAGFQWWEIDTSFRVIQLLECLGIVWDVRRVPAENIVPKVRPVDGD